VRTVFESGFNVVHGAWPDDDEQSIILSGDDGLGRSPAVENGLCSSERERVVFHEDLTRPISVAS
jgi:hypothetical protein